MPKPDVMANALNATRQSDLDLLDATCDMAFAHFKDGPRTLHETYSNSGQFVQCTYLGGVALSRVGTEREGANGQAAEREERRRKWRSK